ncbi:MAG: S-layer homology domain-containing protein [Armatimonadota bacterium]|nr:S-layer homology domain-containing protein [Armatimonadota bacterium]
MSYIKGTILAAIALIAVFSTASLYGSLQMFSDIQADPRQSSIERVAELRILQGYPDGTFRANLTVNEEEFERTLDRLAVACPDIKKPDFSVKSPKEAVTRVRAVVAIMRGAADATAVDSIAEPAQFLSCFSDYREIPAWAVKYVAFAVDRGYMQVESKFRPSDHITRSELAGILARCLSPVASTKTVVETVTVTAVAGVTNIGGDVTGLIVDCRGLGLKRCMSPSIVSENGERVYPDPKNLPSINYIETHGLASYVSDIANAKRLGSTPLEVKAVRVEGVAHQIAVISDSDRELIVSENRKSKFLAKYNVTFLIDPK